MNIDELLPFYALDAVSDEERAFVEAYLENHPERLDELRDLQSGADALAFEVQPLTPDPATKQVLMSRIAAKQRTRPVERQRTPSLWQQLRSRFAPAAVGFAFAALALIWAFSLSAQLETARARLALLESSNGALQQQVADLQTQNGALQRQLEDNQIQNASLQQEIGDLEAQQAQLQQQLQDNQRLLAVLRDPAVRTFALEETGVQTDAQGRFVVNERVSQALLTVSDLTPLDVSQTYQFWLIGPDGPVSAGLLDVDNEGVGSLLLDVNAVDRFDAIGVSIEPAGGSEQPTGDIVLLGQLP